MSGSIDLDSYFARIGWTGATAPTHATLAGLLEAHTARIPFENFDVLLGRPIRLDLDSLQAKLVHARRGGYCFEHATLFAAVLEQLGFDIVRHTARVVLFAPHQAASRGHMFILVKLADGMFIADPGFAGFTSRTPIPLIEGRSVEKGGMTHGMVRDDRHWVLRVSRGGQASDGWVTTLDADNPTDFEMGSYFVSTHPAAPMRNILLLNAMLPDGRVSVMNRDVTIQRGTSIEKRQIADRRALRALVAEHFGFDVPEIETMKVPAIPEWA